MPAAGHERRSGVPSFSHSSQAAASLRNSQLTRQARAEHTENALRISLPSHSTDLIAAANCGWTVFSGLVHDAYAYLETHGCTPSQSSELHASCRGSGVWLARTNLSKPLAVLHWQRAACDGSELSSVAASEGSAVVNRFRTADSVAQPQHARSHASLPAVVTTSTLGGGWARNFGYDIFISFALGPPPRGTRAYASDLARRLRELGFTVFFSEDEAPVGGELDVTLRRALQRSRVLVVVANRETLADPRWVRTEVEEYRRQRPRGTVVPISIDSALQDPLLGPVNESWLQHGGRIWIDESAEAGNSGRVSDLVVERLVTAPHAMRSQVRLRIVLTLLFLLMLSLALWALFEGIAAAEQRDKAQRSLLVSASQQALLLSREGRAREGWDALVYALALAQPKVDRALPEGFLEAALITLVEDRRGPDLRFDESAAPPPVRELGNIEPPAVAFDAEGLHVAVAAGRHVGVWSSADGHRLVQVRLDFEPDQLTFNSNTSLLVAEGRATATSPGDDLAGPARAVAISLAGGEVLQLPLGLCRHWLPCIGTEREPKRLQPLAELPDLVALKAGKWPPGSAFLASRAEGLRTVAVSQGRFHLLKRERQAGRTQWMLVDAQTGGALELDISLEARPENLLESPNDYTLARDAPWLATGAINSPWMKRLRIHAGQPQPSLTLAGEVRAPKAGATQKLSLTPQGTQLRYQTWRYGTGTGFGIGRTAVVDLDLGRERWSRGEGEVVWGDALIALQEDWGQTEVLDASTGTTWFSTSGRPLTFDPTGRRLLMWDMPDMRDRETAVPNWPAIRLVEALPLRQFARDPRGPASTRSACMDLRDLRFLTMAERTDRVWNQNDFHRMPLAAATPGEDSGSASATSGRMLGATQPNERARFRAERSQWVLEDEHNTLTLDSTNFIQRFPELAELAGAKSGVTEIEVQDSRDGNWRVVVLLAAEGDGVLRKQCPSGKAWRLHRRGEAKTVRQACISAEVTAPGYLPLPQFLPAPSAQADALLLAAPIDSCNYTLFDVESGRSYGSVTPVFGANVHFEFLAAGLLGVASTDWYGATLSYQWQTLGSSSIGPVFMLAYRNEGEDEVSPTPKVTALVPAFNRTTKRAETTPTPMPRLFAQEPQAEIEEAQAWSLKAALGEIRLTAGDQHGRVAVPPWGEQLREKLRLAVKKRLGS